VKIQPEIVPKELQKRHKKHCAEVKSEKFWLWEYYKPTGKVLGEGAYAIVIHIFCFE